MNDLQPRVVYVPVERQKPPVNWAKVAVAVVVAVVYWLWPLDVLPGLPIDDLALVIVLLRWAGLFGELSRPFGEYGGV